MEIDMNELNHFGIKGMKWGIRRYQNKDGSLTAAGKKKYNDSSESRTSARKKAGEDARSTQGEVKRYGKDAAKSAFTGGTSGALLIAAGGGFLGIPVAVGAYAGTKLASGGYYYKRQAYNYKNYNVEKNKREQKSK